LIVAKVRLATRVESSRAEFQDSNFVALNGHELDEDRVSRVCVCVSCRRVYLCAPPAVSFSLLFMLSSALFLVVVVVVVLVVGSIVIMGSWDSGIRVTSLL